MPEPIMDFSRTQRVVLSIDLQPLLTLENPNSYLTTVLAAAKRLLTLPPLSASSLFAFKLFFSSLSPLRSSSAVHRLLPSPNSLSFNQAAPTLTSLTQALDSLSRTPSILAELSSSSPSASHISSALLQLVHDYAWESETEIGNDTDNVNDFAHICSNLVVLFSPVCKSLSCLFQFMNVELNHECSDQLIVKFCSLFSVVSDAFISRDIYLSWVNVNCESQDENEVAEHKCRESLEFFEKGIKSLNWGFCSTNAIVLGSALIPFELIYPKIGIRLNFSNFSNLQKRSAQLSLEILDVNGKPLECKCCDLELVNLRSLQSVICDDFVKVLEFRDSQGGEFGQGKGFSCFGDGMMKLHLNAVCRNNEEMIEGCSSNYLLVQEFSGESKKSKKKCSEEFFGDKVMEILSNEPGETSPANPVPIWQILLSFLHKEGYCVVLSLSDEIGNTATGILKPFTAHWALLSIMDDDSVQGRDCCGSNPTRKVTQIHKSCHNTIDVEGFIGSQNDTSTSGNCEPSLGEGKRRKSKKHRNLDLTWSTFCKAALECSHFDLAEVYFTRKLNKSKKLKFLKCWMRQIRKCSQDSLSAMHVPKSTEEQLMSPSTEQCQVPEKAIPFTCSESESSESFFSNLPRRIEHGLKSKMDLQTLAERVVKSSFYWLSRLCETDKNMADQNPRIDDACSNTVLAKLKKLLLKEPKEMKELRDHNDSFPVATGPNIIVREYELQIFLRMEILGSNVSESIEEPAKQKLLKQICSFLEIIQYLVEGGIHGQIKLYDYVERNIKFRYSHILEDIVNEIYTQMDLLPFGDEDEAQNLLLNSEDSNQSWRDTQEFYGKAETNNVQQSVSADDGSNRAPQNVDESVQETREDECAHKLNEARERRERARRFVSFTRRAPDLQRIWAPKQSKAIKGKPEPLRKESRRKNRRRGNESVVCETPLSGRKRPSEAEGEFRDGGNSHSVSKALFQDS